MAELTFGPLLTPEGGNLGAISINPTIPHADEGFNIQWADANIDLIGAAGPYKDTIWITDDRNNDVNGNPVIVWVQTIQLAGLAPGQSDGRVVSVPPGVIRPGKYTFHVYIDSQNDIPELDLTDSSNYNFNAGIDISNSSGFLRLDLSRGIFIDLRSIYIGCPGSVSVKQNTGFSGGVSYQIINNTDSDAIFNILIQLIDTKGSRTEFSQTFQVVSANGYLNDSHDLFLNAFYENSERITATIKIEITGTQNFSDSTYCEFDVV